MQVRRVGMTDAIHNPRAPPSIAIGCGMSWMTTEGVGRRASLSEWTVQAARDVLDGRSRSWRGYLAFAGPAVVASIAYMDPGNFATNIQAGAKYGYGLLWVVLLANLIAMLFQALSAKLGIVTGRNLAELCREHLPRPVVGAMWVVSEIAAMATDLAELLGGAIGLSLLFKIPLLAGMTVTAMVVYGILLFQRNGFRPIELIIGSLVATIGLCYLIEIFIVPVDWGSAAWHSVVPQLAGPEALALAVGIIGATVMPHAIYLHSGLTQARLPARNVNEKWRIVRASNREVVVALAIAGLVNMAMVLMAAGAFHAGHSEVAEIETAYHTLAPLLGAAAAGVFLISLLASGVSSSAVGTMAGQMIMQGFVGFTIPIWLRRLVTMLPALVVVALGVDATSALVVSQIVLSLALPLPMVALLWFTRRAGIMGRFANSGRTQAAAVCGTAVILALNAVLILQTLGVAIPGLPSAV
ncbi:MAG TPA: Nramp family divalent metal transporter [Stellaceae bacterium]|nr:Nramp family divalent metal transporter [Stellaceae bacterium]